VCSPGFAVYPRDAERAGKRDAGGAPHRPLGKRPAHARRVSDVCSKGVRAQPLPRTLRRIGCGQDNSTEYQERAMARYGKKASEKVERAMHEMKRGELRSGSSGKKVKSRKQAVAIGLSEARRAGGKVPKKSKSSSRSS
jgi:hypothetical protein